MKERLNIYIPLFIILNLIFLGFPQHLIAQDNQIDNKLITAARSKANGMGHNPITLYTDENGHVVFTEGNMLTIRNGKSGIAEGDMVVNVGQRDSNVAGTILKKGEYGVVVKNGKFEKASDRIGEIRRSSYLWLIVLVGIGSMVFFVIAKRKKRNITSDNSRIQPQAISSSEKLENKPPQQNNPFSEKILNFLDENPLSIGIFDEFKKGQEDFSNWGDGVLTGSKEWVVNKLCNKLSEIGVSNPPSIRRTQNYQWQTSNLEGFTARIEASLPNMLAGFYIGRIGENLYGLFGCNINHNENEIESTSKPIHIEKPILNGLCACDSCGKDLNKGQGVLNNRNSQLYCEDCWIRMKNNDLKGEELFLGENWEEGVQRTNKLWADDTSITENITSNKNITDEIKKESSSVSKSLIVGMPLAEIIEILGPPSGSIGGTDVIRNTLKAGATIHSSTTAMNMMTQKTFMEWNRPEGRYRLVIENGLLARVYSAPENKST
jgi:hypothetical protein